MSKPTWRMLAGSRAGAPGMSRPRKLAEQDSALGCAGGVVACHGADFGKGFVDALDRELGAFPTEGGPAEASPKCPGMHEE